MAKNNEEYQFKEEGEYLGESPEPITPPDLGVTTKPSRSLLDKLPVKNRKIIIIIGIVVVIFFIMQIVKLFSPSPKEKIQPQQPSALEATQPQSANISALTEKYKTEETKISDLQNEVEDMKTTVNNMNKMVYDLNTTVQQLTVEVQKLIAERDALMQTMKGKRTPYHIKAIVPGRAWLETTHGVNTTVRIGTSLGKYGNVTEIDDQNGMVTTNKGAVIRYGANDL